MKTYTCLNMGREFKVFALFSSSSTPQLSTHCTYRATRTEVSNTKRVTNIYLEKKIIHINIKNRGEEFISITGFSCSAMRGHVIRTWFNASEIIIETSCEYRKFYCMPIIYKFK